VAVPSLSREDLGPDGRFDPSLWPGYRKTTVTRALRMDGPFTVETREGTVTCRDGYLAVDAGGWPYPIAADEFEAIYEQVYA
jgi:hypothetical protein